MQQNAERRRPTAEIYRPPIGEGRITKFRRYNSFRPEARGLNPNGIKKIRRPFNKPYDPQTYDHTYHSPRQRGNTRNRIPRRSRSENYRITIPGGKKLGMTVIYKAIQSVCEGYFIPYNFNFVDEDAIFYMTDRTIVGKIKNINNQIATPDGKQIEVHVFLCQSPPLSFDPETLEMIKNIVSARYVAESHSLNLAEFSKDENMKSLGLCLPLNNTIVLNTITTIITDNIPELENLDLSNNCLCYISKHLHAIASTCQQLKCLNLKRNRLDSIKELKCIKELPLIDLVLEANPLCHSYRTKTIYINTVRNFFPKLVTLDGTLLPETIGFDLGSEELPESKKTFFADDNAKDMVLKFLDQYFTIFDSTDRTKLLEAYHDQAYFSLCLSKNTPKNNKGGLGVYLSGNRNLLTVNDLSERFKLLKQGKLSIVAALSELPQTMHDSTSFSIDIFHVSSSLMSFSVTGVFREVKAEIHTTVKTFSRTFVVAPQGLGFVITNETLFLAHASQDQQIKAFAIRILTGPSSCNQQGVTWEMKNEMITWLSKQTGMNKEFTEKCLEENGWEFQRSQLIFEKLQREGKIPPEAFTS